MQYLEFLLARHDTGAALPSGKLTVKVAGSGTLATVYDSSGGVITQPVNADINGVIGFATANGAVDLYPTSADGGYVAPTIHKVQFYDLTQLDSQVAVVVAAGASADADATATAADRAAVATAKDVAITAITAQQTTSVTAVNDAGTAAQTALAALGAPLSTEFRASVKAALGASVSLRCLLEAYTGVTYVSGSNIATWTSADPSGFVFSNYSTLYSGTPKYASQTASKGLLFNRETGLNHDGIILPQTTSFAIHWTMEFEPPDFTYATTAARDAAYTAGAAAFTASISGTTLTVTAISSGTMQVGQTIQPTAAAAVSGAILSQLSGTTGSTGTYQLDTNNGTVTSRTMTGSLHPAGTVVLVNADVNVTPNSPRDVINPLDAGYTTQLVNGYYMRGFSAWNVMGASTGNPDKIWAIYDSTSASNHYIRFSVDRIGQAEVIAQDGTVLVKLSVPATNVRGVSGRQSFGLIASNGSWRLLYNGAEVDAQKTTFANLTNLDRNNINGLARNSGSTNTPVSGDKFNLRTFQIDVGGNYTTRLRSIDAHARYNSTPLARDKKPFYILMVTGQSEANGAHDVSGGYAFADYRGWTGSVTKDGPSATAQSMWPTSQTRRPMPNIFAPNSPANPSDIGPVYLRGGGSGSVTSSTSHCAANPGGVGATETIEYGFFAQVLATNADGSPVYPAAWEADWGIVHSAQSGATLAQISALSVPPKFIPTIRSVATASLTTRELWWRSLSEMIAFAQRRGQRPVVVLVINNQGKGDTTNAAYTAASLADYATIDTTVKSMTGQNDSPIYFRPQVSLSNTGVNLDSNVSPYFDQQCLDVVTGRGSLPIFCPGGAHQFCNRIHHYSYVGWGEFYGDRFARIKWGGEDGAPITYTAARVGNSIRLTLSKAVAFVDTSGMGITGRRQTDASGNYGIAIAGGIDTYGFYYSGAGGHITGVTLTTSTQIDIALSGTPSAGDFLDYMGTGNPFGNVRSATQRLGLLPDIDPTATITSGSIAYQVGATNWDISEWMPAQHVVVP